MNKIKVLLIMFLILIVIITVLIITSPDQEELKGKGMGCFNECVNVCTENDSKVYVFSATDTKCSCTCFNGYQTILDI